MSSSNVLNRAGESLSAYITTLPTSSRSPSIPSDFQGLELKIPFAHEPEPLFLTRNVVSPPPLEVIKYPFDNFMVPGVGISSLTGQATGAFVVEHDSLRRLEGAAATSDGQTSKTTIKVVETTQELFQLVSATMSGGGSYGIFSGSASGNRSEISKYNSESTTIFASTSIVNAMEYFRNAKLNGDAVKIAKENPSDFTRRFGDYYIQAIVRGGYYIAAINIFSESKDIQKKIAGSIRASFSGFGSGSGSFNSETKALASFSEISIQFLQAAGVGTDHANLGSNLDLLSEKINRFATIVHNNPVTFTVIASPYQSLLNFPSTSRASVDLRFQREHLAEYELQRAQIIGIRNDLQFVQKNPRLFINPPETSKLNEWQKYLSSEQNKLENIAKACFGDSNKCDTTAFTLPNGFIVPDRVDSSVGQEESAKLGTVWLETESGWRGIWRRIGSSRIFEAEWTKGPNEIESALLEIRITGNLVQVKRIFSRNIAAGTVYEGEASYTGTLSEGGKVTGDYKCSWGPREEWSANIQREPGIRSNM